MKNHKIKIAWQKLNKALLTLKIVVCQKDFVDNEILIDATIKRFEYSIELFWKFLKVLIEIQGKIVQFPKDVLRESYSAGLINHEQVWIEMINDRNLTAHTYDEKLAHQVAENIINYYELMEKTFNEITSKLQIDEKL